jgi:hypothetical protein
MLAAANRSNAFNVAIAEHYATREWPNATHQGRGARAGRSPKSRRVREPLACTPISHHS